MSKYGAAQNACRYDRVHMGSWKGFHIWKGRLPHWRADDVTYYVTFRHKRFCLALDHAAHTIIA